MVRYAYTEDDGPATQPDTSFFSSAGAMMLAGIALILGIIPACIFDFAIRAAEAMM